MEFFEEQKALAIKRFKAFNPNVKHAFTKMKWDDKVHAYIFSIVACDYDDQGRIIIPPECSERNVINLIDNKLLSDVGK